MVCIIHVPKVDFNGTFTGSLRHDIAKRFDAFSRQEEIGGLCYRNQVAYLIARAAICISAWVSRHRRRKQSDAAAIRYCALCCGREAMNSATVMSLSDIFMFCSSVGITISFQDPYYGIKKFHRRYFIKLKLGGQASKDFILAVSESANCIVPKV